MQSFDAGQLANEPVVISLMKTEAELDRLWIPFVIPPNSGSNPKAGDSGIDAVAIAASIRARRKVLRKDVSPLSEQSQSREYPTLQWIRHH
jgi:hypothetical protein